MPKPPKAPSIEDLLKSKPPVGSATAPPLASGGVAVGSSATGDELEEKMGDIKLHELEGIARDKAAATGLPYMVLRGFAIMPEAIALVPREISRSLHLVAFLQSGSEIRLATYQPSAEVDAFVKKLGEDQHAHTALYLVSEDSIIAGQKIYDTLPETKEVIYGYRIEEKDLEKFAKEISSFEDLQKKVASVNTTDLLTLIIGAGLQSKASDIHVEAEEADVKVRFRIDGILQDAAKLPRESWKQVIGRLKLLAGVKINVEDVPQDGRITIYLAKEKIDIRVSFLPTAFGESVVMRLLRPTAIALEFDKLGVRGVALERLTRQIDRPNGMIITTGPTGSGKTTTLYAILKKLNLPGVKIITLEDPIEYKLEGINQSQVEHDKHYDFAQGLRSILRQDPDVVMVGEIRDLETADIAIQAALTGHLVVSTIHTNSAAGAIPRFLSMGVKPFLLTPALNAVIGQRLVRRLCTDCKVPATLSTEQSEQIKKILGRLPPTEVTKIDLNNLKFMGPGQGCETCHHLGFKGRVGIYEIFTMNKDIEKVIVSAEISEYQIQELAVKDGMVTMAQDGLLKALDGLTSVEEVLEVVNVDRE
ncbi:type II/IV secretion system protein [Candidatus Uhrbacteria bacterium]|nr:type II/IV secretion system protein [Candidatus Uhrbacteria bacterium]